MIAIDATPPRPLPVPTALSQPYWDGAARGELLIQRCTACGALRHYPRLLCSRCHAGTFDWQRASGQGTVHSWMVAHHAFHPAFREALPYTLVTVDLAEGVRALGLWRGGSALRIGAPVRAVFEPREGGADLAFHEHPQAAANSPPLPAEGVKELGSGASFP